MVFATIVLLSLIGLVVYYAVEIVERIAIPWHVSQQASGARTPRCRRRTRRRNHDASHVSRRSSPPLSRSPRATARARAGQGVAAPQLVPGRPARAVLLRQGPRLLRRRRHRPHDQRGPRLGEHRAGRRRRLRHVRARRLVVGRADRGEGRRRQERDVAAQHDRLLGRLARRDEHQDAEGPRRQEGRGDAGRPARPAAAGGVQGEQRRLQQDLDGAGRSGRQGRHRAREEGRRAARRRRRPVLPDQVQRGVDAGGDALRRLRRQHRRHDDRHVQADTIKKNPGPRAALRARDA